jgi:hypothetical protein
MNMREDMCINCCHQLLPLHFSYLLSQIIKMTQIREGASSSSIFVCAHKQNSFMGGVLGLSLCGQRNPCEVDVNLCYCS